MRIFRKYSLLRPVVFSMDRYSVKRDGIERHRERKRQGKKRRKRL